MHFMMMSGASSGENPPTTRNDTGGVLDFDAVDNGKAQEEEEKAKDPV